MPARTKLDGRISTGVNPSSHYVRQLSVSSGVLLSNYSDIFKAELGMIVDFKAKLLVKPGTISKFCKARSVPFAIKGAIEGELDRLEAAEIMER